MAYYLRTVKQRAAFALRESLKDIRPIDYFCILAALCAIGYMIHSPVELARVGEVNVGPRAVYQALRGVIIALGVLILIDRRAQSKTIKVAVTLVVIGLSMNIARNVNPSGLPLTLSYATASSGTFIWFMTILFRLPWQEKYERMKAIADDYRARLSKYENVDN